MNKKINLVIATTITLGASILVITANSNSSTPGGVANATGYNILYNGDFSKGTTNWTGISSISEDENGKYATLRNGESVNTSYINILPKAEYNFSFKYKIISFTSGNGLTPILSYYSSSNQGVYSDYIFDENSGHFMRDTTVSSDWISVSFNFQALDYDMASYYGFNTGGATVQVRDCALTFVNQSPNIIGLGKYNDLDNCAVYGGGTFEYGNGVIGGKGYTENYGLGIESGNHSSDPSWGFVEGCNSLTAIKAYNANALEWKIGRLDLINDGTLYGICLKANVVYEVSFDYKVQKYDTSDTRDLSFRASFGCGKNAFGEHDYENICS
ncbi:MAG: hypothetical protein HUJ59_05685, partial [Bacilli bacterium]|nr:hypothetical protein [Bacilli bacterium]